MYVFRPLLDIEIYDRLTNDLKLIPSITRIQFHNCYKKISFGFPFFSVIWREININVYQPIIKNLTMERAENEKDTSGAYK